MMPEGVAWPFDLLAAGGLMTQERAAKRAPQEDQRGAAEVHSKIGC